MTDSKPEADRQIDLICNDFEGAWLAGKSPQIEDYLTRIATEHRESLFNELLLLEIELRGGDVVTIQDYARFRVEFPHVLEHALSRSHLSDPSFADPDKLSEDATNDSAETVASSRGPVNVGDAAASSRRLKLRANEATTGIFAGYELIEEVARGGMGIVYKARQLKLNRICALKMILAGHFANDEEISRFLAEAEAAANLDHAGIVPVYEVGEYKGQHFFSMGYVDGTSLQDKLRDGPLPPNDAATLVQKIADAVQHAHSQGVIHRDLKPANVLIDTHGNPRVTDFGLAKRLQADSDLTGTGQILGTPSFMPPEQAAGKITEITVTSDVYSLGALLYALLTARPPFQTGTAMETLKQVIENDPISVTDLNDRVPMDLETICLKCLQKEPDRRYQTAADLSAELRRFLDGQPILARPISRTEKMWRWCRRNQVTAGLIGTCIVLLIGGTVTSAVFAVRSAQHARLAIAAKERAVRDKEVAVKLLGRARDAVDAWLIGAAEDLLYYPGVQQFRKDLLEQAVREYAFLTSLESEDPLLELERANTLVRLGDIHQLLGDIESATRAYERAVSLFESSTIQQEPPAVIGFSSAQTSLGRLVSSQGQFARSESFYRSGNEASRRALETYPDHAGLRNALGTGLFALSQHLSSTGSFAAADAALNDARLEFERAYALEPANLRYRRNMLSALQEMGAQLTARGRYDDATSLIQDALAKLDSLIEAGATPDVIECRAVGKTILASIHRQTGLIEDELTALESALRDYEFLTAELPHINRYLEGRGKTMINLGQLYVRRAENRKATDVLMAVVNHWDNLVSASPMVLRYHEHRAASHGSLGLALADMGRFDDAKKHLDTSIAELNRLVEFDQVPDYRVRLAVALSQYGQLNLRLNEDQHALEALSVAVQGMENLLSTHPLVAHYADVAATVYANLAFCFRELGQNSESKRAFKKAINIWRTRELQNSAEHRANLAWILVMCPYEDLREPSEAVDIAQTLVKAVPTQARYHAIQAAAFYRQGAWDAALASLRRFEERWGEANDLQLFLRAMTLSRQGKTAAARDTFLKASQWMEERHPGNLDALRLRDEAAQLLGMN